MSPSPTHTYTLAISFTGLAGLVIGGTAGGKCFVRNRNTREAKYYDAKGKADTIATLLVDTKNWTTAWTTADVIEVGMMGAEHGTAIHTVNITKGGGKITLPVTATSTTTHPNVTL